MIKIQNSKKGFIQHHKAGAGFTLIELLIVIAIIGVLATLLMANFIGVRQRARDSQRKSDLRQIQSSLEIWRSDNGDYPDGSSEYPAACGPGAALQSGSTIYMATVPCDPNGVKYVYAGGGTGYTLYACLENSGDSQADNPKRDECAVASFTVQNP
jgi:type II secretion system protein G